MLGDMHRELDAYQTMVSHGEGLRVAADGFRSRLGLIVTEIRHTERDLRHQRGLIDPQRSLLESLYGPLDKLKTASKLLNGPETAFQRVLNELIRKRGVTTYALATFHNGDPSYIYKLLSGERRKPSRDSVTRIAIALTGCSPKISEKDANHLLQSAGYPPLKR